jgi:hypothetical protein
MSSTATFRESRRSTRVPLKVLIAIEGGGAESRACEGETIVVNLHGALIATAIGLSTGMRISIHVYLTDKRAVARVVYNIDPRNRFIAGSNLMSRETFGEYSSRAGVAPAEVQRLSRRTVTTVTQRLNCHEPASGRLN